MKRFASAAWAITIALLCLVACGPGSRSDTSAACDLGSPTILMEAGASHEPGSRLLQMWDVRDSPVLWSETAPLTSGYQSFRKAVTQKVSDTDPVRLLKDSQSIDDQLATNNELVARSAAAWIRPAGCLEMYMQGIQHARMDTFTAPTEFASFILRSADGSRLRIYFYTTNEDGIGRVTPLADAVEQDHAAGWRLLIALHTHVFHPGQPQLNGILAPSTADAQFMYAYGASVGLAEAWISNGIHTVRIPSADFERFEREE